MTESTQPTIDVNVDRAFQERFWIAVRIGWVAMALLFLAALLGATGSGGILSSQTLEVGGGEIELPSVSRWSSADTMTVTLSDPARRTSVLVPTAFGDVFAIDAISPQPNSVTGSPEGDLYLFELQPAGGEMSIDFSIRASHPVWSKQLGAFEVNDVKSATTTFTVLP